MSTERSIIVIGAGVIGLNVALQCARRGHEITILDRGAERGSGCSGGNAGMIVPSHFIPLAAPGAVGLALKWMLNPRSPLYIQPRLDLDLLTWSWRFFRSATAEHVRRAAPLLRDLSLASRALFAEFARESEFGLTQRGLLMLCRTQHGLDDEAGVATRARALGIEANVLDAQATAALEPGITMDILGAVHFPQDCHLSPTRFLGALENQAVKLGVKIERETSVVSFRREGDRITSIETSRGSFVADEVVICGGAWSPSVAAQLDLSLPMQAGKGYALTVGQPPELPALCAICTEARVAVTPMDGALRFAGTMEIAGLNERINPTRVSGIVESAGRYFPAYTPDRFAGLTPWAGLRPCSPDGLPLIGRTNRCENLVVATGHGMLGLSLGPVTGQLVGEILSEGKASIDLTLLSPDRFA